MFAPQQDPLTYVRRVVSSYNATRCLYTATLLGVADCLKDDTLSVEQIAKETQCKPDLLYRVLRALASINFFKEGPAHHFSNTAESHCLRGDHPSSLKTSVLLQLSDSHFASLSELHHQVKTGEQAHVHMFNETVWERFAKIPERGEMFNRYMNEVSKPVLGIVVDKYFDYSPFKTIVDVGGGHGHLLYAILERKAAPDAKGILFDLPHVIADAKKVKIASPEVIQRVSFQTGSFFDSVPSNGDLYVLKWIIHDYDDDHARKILQNVRKAMNPNGQLLIVDAIIEQGNEFQQQKFTDIVMMTILNAKERTVAEFEELVKGLFTVSKVYGEKDPVSILQCTPI